MPCSCEWQHDFQRPRNAGIVPTSLQLMALTTMYYLECLFYSWVIFRKSLSVSALGLQDERRDSYHSDQKRTAKEEKKRESKRPLSLCGNHQADLALIWRRRPGGDTFWRACAGLTSGGLGRKVIGPDPALLASGGGLHKHPTDWKWHCVLLESVLASYRDDLNSLHLSS